MSDNSTSKKEWKDVFLETLARTGNVSDSARKAKVPRHQVYWERENSPEFKVAWDAAQEIAVDSLEGEAWRRAKTGVLKPVYQGGEKIGQIREYSDTLLIFLLKGHRSRVFNRPQQLEHSGPNGQPLAVQVYIPANARDDSADSDPEAATGTAGEVSGESG